MTTHKDYLEHKREQGKNVSLASKYADNFGITSETLASDVDSFLAAGGKIQHLPFGVVREERKMTELENRDRMRNTAYMKGTDSIGRKKSGMHDYNEKTMRARLGHGL